MLHKNYKFMYWCMAFDSHAQWWHNAI